MYVFSFLLSAVAFMLLAFSLHLFFTKQGSRMLNVLLGLPLIARLGQVCVFLLISTNYQYLFPLVQQLTIPFFFIAPACSYLYIKYFISRNLNFKRIDYLHLIPFLFGIAHVLPFGKDINWNAVADQIIVRGQFSVQLPTGIIPMEIYNFVKVALSGIYLFASCYLLLTSSFLKGKWNLSKTWICFYLSISSFFKLISFIALGFNLIERSYLNNIWFLIMSSAVMLFMLLFVLYQPRILYGYILISADDIRARQSERTYTNKRNLNEGDAIDQEFLQKMQNIEALMANERLFLQQDFQISDLASSLNIPVHQCSTVINLVVGKNFRDWLNSYRIKYFIEEYPQSASAMTIDAIALQSGFRNITTFYNAFKKETGKMPKTYFRDL